jgi:hypothetical protein
MRPTRTLSRALCGFAFLILLRPLAAGAQVVTFEAVGERALGMGGAVVGVSDDATAVAWNPAGLVAGGPAGMTIGWNQLQVGKSDGPVQPGFRRQRATLTSLGTWPLGISYGTVDVAEVSHSGTELGVFRSSYLGLSVLQSIMPGLVVGSTMRVMRGGQSSGLVGGPTLGDALSAASGANVSRRTVFDLDVAAMASSPRVRIGVALKNLRSPRFDRNPGSLSPLPRQARAGLALLPSDGVTLAIDVDLNAVDLTGGPRQECAIGGETRIGSRLSVRSGVRWSLKGARALTGAVGASLRVRQSLWLDGHYGLARHDEAREGGVALRAGC